MSIEIQINKFQKTPKQKQYLQGIEMNGQTKFTLQRPPKPQPQKSKQMNQNLSSVNSSTNAQNNTSETNGNRNRYIFNFESNNLKLISRKRPSSQESVQHGLRFYKKKIEDSNETNILNQGPDGPNSLLITPKYVSAQTKPASHNTFSLQPSAFKIRNISIQIKKVKQNLQQMQANVQINKIEIQAKEIRKLQKNYTSQTNKLKKQKIGNFFEEPKPIQLQSHFLVSNPIQEYLHTFPVKTCVQMYNKPPLSQLCVVISQNMFEQAIINQQSLFQLKSFCDRLYNSTYAIIILHIYKKQRIFDLKNGLSQLNIHIHNLHYFIWNQDKYVQNINFVYLPKLESTLNYIIIYRQNSWVHDMYVGCLHIHSPKNQEKADLTHPTTFNSHEALLNKKKRNRYLYLEVKNFQKVNQFIANLSIHKEHGKEQQFSRDQNNINILNMQIEQESVSLSTSVCSQQYHKPSDRFIIKFNKYSDVLNKTQQIFDNYQINEMVRFLQKENSKKAKSSFDKIKNGSNNGTRSKSKEACKANKQVVVQFDENFKAKMIQYAKIIYMQSKQKQKLAREQKKSENPSSNSSGSQGNYAMPMSSNSNYMKIRVPQQIGNLMGGCQISANTAYQFVGQLLRNNAYNYKQISLFINQSS